MANGIGMEDVVFYAKVGPENLKKLGVSTEGAVFQTISQDTVTGSGSSYKEILMIGNPSSKSGFPQWMVNEAIGSLSGKGYITTNPEEAYELDSSFASDIPASVVAANNAVAAIPVASVESYSPPDILIPGGNSSSLSSSLSPEIANAIGVDQEVVNSHSKKDAKKEKKVNMMNLMDGLSTGRMMDAMGKKNDFGDSMKDVGVGSLMEGLSLKMSSIPLDGREMKGSDYAYEDDDDNDNKDDNGERESNDVWSEIASRR